MAAKTNSRKGTVVGLAAQILPSMSSRLPRDILVVASGWSSSERCLGPSSLGQVGMMQNAQRITVNQSHVLYEVGLSFSWLGSLDQICPFAAVIKPPFWLLARTEGRPAGETASLATDLPQARARKIAE
jgi:hypothetical protein